MTLASPRTLAALGGALALAVVAPGCGARETGVTTLRFWAMGQEGERVRPLLATFEREHPGVTIEVQALPWTAAHEKLLTAFVGRTTPDVAQLGNTWIPEFAALGALAPLDARVARSAVVNAGTDFPGIWDTNVVDGTLYGVPWYVDTRVLFYRKDLLARAGWPEAPRTWSEWLAAMRALRASGTGVRAAILLPVDEWAQPVILGFQQGATLLRDDGRWGAFQDPAFRRAVEFYAGLFREGLAPNASNVQVANLYQQFAAGDFAMYITGPWNLGEFRRRLPAGLQEAWDTAPLPTPDGSAWPGLSLAGGSSLALFATSRHPELAWQLIEYLSRPEVQLAFYEVTGDLPARRAAWDAPPLAGEPRARAFRLQLDRVQPAPRVPEWENIAWKVAENLDATIRGGRPVDASLAALDRDVDGLLAKRRYLLERAGRVDGGGPAAPPAADSRAPDAR